MTALPLCFAVLATLASSASEEVLRAARVERERRARLERKAPVLDDKRLQDRVADLPLSTLDGERLRELEAAALAKAAAPATAKTGAAAVEATTAVVKDERYFRSRMAEARQRIEGLELDLGWAQRRSTMLRSDLVVPGDPLREYNRRVELDAALADQARIAEELVEARREPARIREEGRREGALPAWFR